MATFAEGKSKVISFLEDVACRTDKDAQQFTTYSAINQMLGPKKFEERAVTDVRAAALSESNELDASAGRPFLSAVVLDDMSLLPRKEFFADLKRLKQISTKTEEEKIAVHRHELKQTLAFPWRSIERGALKQEDNLYKVKRKPTADPLKTTKNSGT